MVLANPFDFFKRKDPKTAPDTTKVIPNPIIPGTTIKVPASSTEGFTPDKDSSGRVVYNSPFRGGGTGASSGGGGSSGGIQESDRIRMAQEAQARAAQEAALIEKTRQEGIARLEKQRMEKEIQDARTQAKLQEIEANRNRILSEGARVTEKTSRDVKTGNILKITETRRGGELIRDVINTETGETKTTSFAPGVGGGSVRQTGGIISREQPVDPKTILAPNGQVGNLNNAINFNANEIFNPGLNAFISQSEPSGQATGFIRQPTVDEAERIRSAAERGSLTGINTFAERFTTPEGVRSIFSGGAELTLKGGDALKGITQSILTTADKPFGTGIKTDSSLFTTSSPISRQTAKDIITNLYLFSAFSPLIETATSQQLESQFADDVVEVVYKGQRVKMTASEAKQLGLNPMTRLQATSEFAQSSSQKQLEILKKAFKGRAYLDEASLQQDIVRAARFMKEAGVSDNQAKSLLFKLFPPKVAQQQTSTILVQQTTGAQLEQLPELLTGVSTLNPSQVGETNFITSQGLFQDSLTDLSTKQSQGQVQSQKTAQLLSFKSAQLSSQSTAQKQEQKQRQRLLFGQDLKIGQLLKTDQLTKQLQRLKTNQLFKTEQLSKTKQAQKLKSFSGSFYQPQKYKGEKMFGVPLFFGGRGKKSKPTNLYGVSIRRKGKFLSPFTTNDINKALSVGKSRTENTLAASFLLTGGKKLLPNIPGFRKKKSSRGTIFIERRSRRLKKRITGSREVAEIMRSRKNSLRRRFKLVF